MPVSEKRNELTVGLFLLIGLAMLGGLVLQFGRFKEHFSGHYTITVVFDDASGVIKGSEVRMGGARIGQVAELPELNEAVQVEVELAISEGIHIPVGSSFQINSATLLGDKLIVIIPPAQKNGMFIDPGSRHRGAGPTGLDALQNNAEAVARKTVELLQKAEETFNKVDSAVETIQSASGQLSEAVGKINHSVLADANLANLDTTIGNLTEASRQWKETSAKFDPTLAEVRETIASVKTAADGMQKTLTKADSAIDTIKPAFQGVPAAVDKLSRTTQKAGDVFDRMRRGEGMLGAFASDNDVALDFKAFMSNLRRHGILRYKNDNAKPKDAKPKETPPGRLGGVRR